MAPLALLTRPRPDSEALAALLNKRGVGSLIEPVIEILPLSGAKLPELNDIQALLITSANGVRALVALLAPPPEARHIPLLVVGPASAEAALKSGFTNVQTAGGNVTALAALVRERLDPAAGPILHITGSKVAGDLASELQKSGFELRRQILYEGRQSVALSHAAHEALRRGKINMVLFFSPRSAHAFVTLVRAASLESTLARSAAICLSANVAEAAEAAVWRRIRTARKPEQAALLEEVAREVNMANYGR